MFTVYIRGTRAAKLIEPVDAESARSMEASEDYPLQPGQVLTGLFHYPDTYCAILEPHGMGGQAAPCLVDRDGDGRFEAIEKAGLTSTEPEALTINYKGKIVGVTFSLARPLPHPVPYMRIPYTDGPSAIGTMIWRSFSKDNPTDRPAKITFWVEAGQDSTGTDVLSLPLSFTTRAGSSAVNVDGIGLHILGFGSDGSMQWQAGDLAAQRNVVFGYRPGRRTFYFYLPR